MESIELKISNYGTSTDALEMTVKFLDDLSKWLNDTGRSFVRISENGPNGYVGFKVNL